MYKQEIHSKVKYLIKKKYTLGDNQQTSNQSKTTVYRTCSRQLNEQDLKGGYQQLNRRGSKYNSIEFKRHCSKCGYRQLNINEQGSKSGCFCMWCITYAFNLAVQKMKLCFRRYMGQQDCTQEVIIIFNEDEVGSRHNQTPKLSRQNVNSKQNVNTSAIKISSATLKRNSHSNTWRMRTSRKKHTFTKEMLHEAVKLSGPDVLERYTAYINGLGDNNMSHDEMQLVYVVLFPEDCRLFLSIPTTTDSFIYSKELIYLQEYPR